MRPDRGIVVMAYGSHRYLRQAQSLALSLDLNSPGIGRTLVTDRPGSHTAGHYDTVVPLDGPRRTDCRPKLDLTWYTPYRRTLYIDADSLVVRRLDPLFTLFHGHDFVVIDKNITSGHWYGNVTDMRRLAGSPSLPQFNGGFLYFTDTPRARRIFVQARHLASAYDALGYDRFNRGIADEPLLAIALAAEGLPAHNLTHVAMATPLGATGPIMIDVLTGLATFEKRGRTATPAVVHFAADYSSRRPLLGAHYRRERLKVTLAHRLELRNATARAASIMLYGAPCWLLNQSLRRPSRRAAALEPPATEAP